MAPTSQGLHRLVCSAMMAGHATHEKEPTAMAANAVACKVDGAQGFKCAGEVGARLACALFSMGAPCGGHTRGVLVGARLGREL